MASKQFEDPTDRGDGLDPVHNPQGLYEHIENERKRIKREEIAPVLEDIAVEVTTFATGTLAAATGDFPALGGFNGIRERIKMGITYLRENGFFDWREETIDTVAFYWSTAAGITGDYPSLGGYEGIRARVELMYDSITSTD